MELCLQVLLSEIKLDLLVRNETCTWKRWLPVKGVMCWIIFIEGYILACIDIVSHDFVYSLEELYYGLLVEISHVIHFKQCSFQAITVTLRLASCIHFAWRNLVFKYLFTAEVSSIIRTVKSIQFVSETTILC